MEQYDLKQAGRWVYVRPEPTQFTKQLLIKELSYRKKGAEFMTNPLWADVHLYQKGRHRFPIGLLHRVKRLLNENQVEWDAHMKQWNVSHLDAVNDGLYDFQKSAVNMALIRSGGILQIPTGGGKTRTALSIIKTLNFKTLVVVPSLMLLDQWNEQIDKELVEVRTYQSLKSKKHLQQFNLVIFDECHKTAAKTLQGIGMNLNDQAITLGLSATPFMRDDDNLKVESVIGPVVYKISLRELIRDGYLVDAIIHYHKLDFLDTTFMNYHMAYDNYIINNTQRNGKIIKLADEAEGHTLVLVNQIKHGEELLKDLLFLGQDVVFLNGSTKAKDRNTNHKIVIATSIMDEGVDIPHLKTLILAGGGKSAIKSTQRIGRVLRKFEGKGNAIVHDFQDNCKWLSEHSDERRKIYENDFEVVDVNN